MGKYSKAIVGAIVAAGTAYIAASLDGVVTGEEVGIIVGALFTGLGLTWLVPNAQQSDRTAR